LGGDDDGTARAVTWTELRGRRRRRGRDSVGGDLDGTSEGGDVDGTSEGGDVDGTYEGGVVDGCYVSGDDDGTPRAATRGPLTDDDEGRTSTHNNGK